ncbi:MAG: hypothetical protein HYU67_04885 [Flavobacteriia bacterium]|nr:hypothetical protein [Flavobacteriia bacterium]
MKFFLFFFSYLIFYTQIFSQLETGSWRMHLTQRGFDIASNGVEVMMIVDNGLVEFDLNYNEISEWSKTNALSDINPSCITYDSYSSSFFVGYKNGNIDKIKNGVVTNIPAIKLSSVGGDKKINCFYSYNKLLYAGTGFGVVVINPDKNEVKDTYYPNQVNQAVKDIVVLENQIIVLQKDKAKSANVNQFNLIDYQQWSDYNLLPELGTEHEYKNILSWNNRLYVLKNNDAYAQDSVFEITNNGLINQINLTFGLEINSIQLMNDKMYVNITYGGVFVFNQNFDLVETKYLSNTYINKSTMVQDRLFSADENLSMLEFTDGNVFFHTHTACPRNTFYSLTAGKKKMIVSGGAYLGSSLSAFNGDGFYVFEEERWTHIYRENQKLWKNKLIFDVLKVAINPNNENQMAVGSYCEYPLALINDGKNIDQIFHMDSSILVEVNVNNGKACISDLLYDDNGNLWIIHSFSKRPLKVLTSDNQWIDFDLGNNIIDKMGGEILIDDNGLKWFTIHQKGITVFDDKGTLDDVTDDEYKQINDGANSGALPSNTVTSIVMDKNNELWIGTSEGFAILNNTSGIMDALPGEYNANRIKLEYEGNVEFLLGNTYINDIEVDGGNRKWIATANSGLFLLSPSGNEILASYTNSNSPLISNTILDICFQAESGELFIVTDLGLVSLRTDASEGKSDFKEVAIFPNPVLPDFDGVITVQGMMENSDVKFTDAAGNLVYQTTSMGGTAIWSGKNWKNEKVAPGTYFVWMSSNTEKGRKVGKVVIIN